MSDPAHRFVRSLSVSRLWRSHAIYLRTAAPLLALALVLAVGIHASPAAAEVVDYQYDTPAPVAHAAARGPDIATAPTANSRTAVTGIERAITGLSRSSTSSFARLRAAKGGKIYKVGGDKTPSGKPYVGRTKQPTPASRGSRDGRDRSDAETVDTYDPADTASGRAAEQGAINREGGVDALDNKRNEVRPDRWDDLGIDP